MTPVKKLSDILQDGLSTMAHFEQRYRDVCVRFVCYRNGQAVHQSGPRSRHQFQEELPHVCKSVGATKVCLTITGSDQHQKGAIQLYNETFRLARMSQPHESMVHLGYGLGSPVHSPAMGMAGAFHNGLGAVEFEALTTKVVADKWLRQEHAKLQTDAEDMRLKIKKLEDELESQTEVNSSRNMIKEYTEMLTPLVPTVASLFGLDKPVGKLLSGLGGTEGAQAGSEAQGDDEQTKMVMGLVRQFMKELGDAHRQQLLSIMMRIKQDHNLITRIAQFTQKPAQNTQATAPKTEPQSQDEQQHK